MRLEIQVPEPSILMQTSFDPISLSSFSWWKHSVAKTMEQRRRRWLGGEKRERERTRAEWVWAFYWPAHTGHVRYLRADCFCSKNSFSWFQSPSLLLLSPKRYTILIQTEYHQFSYPMPLIDFLFSKYLAYLWFWIFERDLVRHWDMIKRYIWVYGLERVIPFVISQASNQWEQ